MLSQIETSEGDKNWEEDQNQERDANQERGKNQGKNQDCDKNQERGKKFDQETKIKEKKIWSERKKKKKGKVEKVGNVQINVVSETSDPVSYTTRLFQTADGEMSESRMGDEEACLDKKQKRKIKVGRWQVRLAIMKCH